MEQGTNRALDAWQGAFGDEYTKRNAPLPEVLGARLKMWSRILSSLDGAPPDSVLEVGANLGLNLRALRLLTQATLTAVEPNASARARLVEDGVLPADRVHDGFGSRLPFADASHDLVFTSGVLIHVPPADLAATCGEIVRVARRYVLAVEYNSEQPVELPYRNHEGLLFKRDFGQFYLETCPGLRVRDYGFFWRPATGLDNLTWWLFEKP
ncbi:MAG TPA: pseudaminic acid biosynthesis-associated methylase [Azospirillum sp.]|nr:pseudaminic acid biosynthesis-associated methylase [Azospirillum sp.]